MDWPVVVRASSSGTKVGRWCVPQEARVRQEQFGGHENRRELGKPRYPIITIMPNPADESAEPSHCTSAPLSSHTKKATSERGLSKTP